MHAVFCLVEHDGSGAFKHLIGDFQAHDAKGFLYPTAHFGVGVVESRQAMHEFDLGIAAGRHHAAVHLVVFEQGNALGPRRFRLAHRHPHIGMDKVHAIYSGL